MLPPAAPATIKKIVAERGTATDSTQQDRAELEPLRIEQTHRTTSTTSEPEPWWAHGRVRHEQQSIGAAVVQAFLQVGDTEPGTPVTFINEARTTANGCFSICLDELRQHTTLRLADAVLIVKCDHTGFEAATESCSLKDVLERKADSKVSLCLQEGAMLKGRVITTTGEPIEGAKVSTINGDDNCEVTGQDGTFYLRPPDRDLPTVLFAAHSHYGRSRAIRMTFAADQERRLPDIVIDIPGNSISGCVRFQSDEPVCRANLELCCANNTWTPPLVDGIQLDREAYADIFLDNEAAGNACTGVDGRYRFCNLPPGSHTITLDGHEPKTVTVDSRPDGHILDFRWDNDGMEAQIHVNIVDRQGAWLPHACYGIHRWTGEAAGIAAQNYKRNGATAELLATATEYEDTTDACDMVTWTTPDTFAIVEACYQNAGPAYAGCRLTPNQYAGSVTVALAPPTHSGTLEVEVLGKDGNRMPATWVRFCRSPTQFAVPLAIPELETQREPRCEIKSSWLRVPDNGRIENLPAGPLTVEVLPLSKDSADPPITFPVTKHRIGIPANGVALLRTPATPGTRLQLELRQPTNARDEMRPSIPRVWITRVGRQTWQTLDMIAPGLLAQGQHRFKDGSFIVQSPFPILEGSYRLEIELQLLTEQHGTREGEPYTTWSSCPCESFDRVVAIAIGNTIVVPLKPKK